MPTLEMYFGAIAERDDARSWACRLLGRVQELEGKVAYLEGKLGRALTEWGRTTADKNKMIGDAVGDVDALVATLGYVFAHNTPCYGWDLAKLSQELRLRVRAAENRERKG